MLISTIYIFIKSSNTDVYNIMMIKVVLIIQLVKFQVGFIIGLSINYLTIPTLLSMNFYSSYHITTIGLLSGVISLPTFSLIYVSSDDFSLRLPVYIKSATAPFN